MSSGKAAVWLKTLGAAGAFAASIGLVERLLASRWIGAWPLALGLAVILVQSGAIALLFLWLLLVKAMARYLQRRADAVNPVIRQKLALHVVGPDQSRELRALRKKHPREVEARLVELLATIAGPQRDRLSALAGELGLTAQWSAQCRSRRVAVRRRAIEKLGHLSGARASQTFGALLSDPDDEVRIAASRAQLRSGAEADLENLLVLATAQPLLTRALLAEELKPFAQLLSRRAIPQLLAAADRDRVRVTLEIIEAWQKVLALPGFDALLHHRAADVRAQAFRVLPYLADAEQAGAEVSAALQSGVEPVAAAAAYAAARLKLDCAIPALIACLDEGEAGLALAAAHALAALGPRGLQALEQAVLRGAQPAAPAALEALERARIGRAWQAGGQWTGA